MPSFTGRIRLVFWLNKLIVPVQVISTMHVFKFPLYDKTTYCCLTLSIVPFKFIMHSLEFPPCLDLCTTGRSLSLDCIDCPHQVPAREDSLNLKFPLCPRRVLNPCGKRWAATPWSSQSHLRCVPSSSHCVFIVLLAVLETGQLAAAWLHWYSQSSLWCLSSSFYYFLVVLPSRTHGCLTMLADPV